ncbi:hypothetical protein [Streptodolium elevatio]|uniref:Uncharacterized protein n=1 Tax=Streptodolium elevatio TaxID=3157996 RepID=A0ABV3DM18_9ACTN
MGDQWAVLAAAVVGAAGGALAALLAMRGTVRAGRDTAAAQHDLWVRQTRHQAYGPALLAFWDTHRAQHDLAEKLCGTYPDHLFTAAWTRTGDHLAELRDTVRAFAVHGSADVAAAAHRTYDTLARANANLNVAVLNHSAVRVMDARRSVADASRAVHLLIEAAHTEIEGPTHYRPAQLP